MKLCRSSPREPLSRKPRTIDVEIYDQKYSIVLKSSLTESEVRQLAQEIDTRMREIAVHANTPDSLKVAILTALHQGNTLGAAVESAFRKSKIAPEERPLKVQTWFQNWATLGWFCRPEKKRAAS